MPNKKEIPFINADQEILKSEKDFDLHKLGHVEKMVEIPGGQEKEFSQDNFGVTEYFDTGGKNHEQFAKLKKFYEAAQEELGDFLPKAMFVEGAPSNQAAEGKSFYVIQKFESGKFYETAKKLEDLNSQEFSVEFLNQLLEIQEKITSFLENHAQDLPDDWVDVEGLTRPQTFKEDVLHSAKTGDTKITNLFRFNPDLVKEVAGNTTKFESSHLQALKALGLGSLIDKIGWAIEKSAAPEWVNGKNVHWQLENKEHEKPIMALTFDDGPNEETEKLLDILKEQNVKATFFLVGSLIPGNEHIVKRIVDEGHDVGVHEWSQEGAPPSEITKNPGEYLKRFVGSRSDLGDVKDTTALIEKVTGKKPTVGRVAGVHGTVDSLREFEAMGLKIIHGHWKDVIGIPPKPSLTSDKLLKKALASSMTGKLHCFISVP
jgi:hypothetical protein